MADLPKRLKTVQVSCKNLLNSLEDLLFVIDKQRNITAVYTCWNRQKHLTPEGLLRKIL